MLIMSQIVKIIAVVIMLVMILTMMSTSTPPRRGLPWPTLNGNTYTHANLAISIDLQKYKADFHKLRILTIIQTIMIIIVLIIMEVYFASLRPAVPDAAARRAARARRRDRGAS